MAYAVYFVAGVIMDAIIALYYLALSSRRAFTASALASIITIATYLILEHLIISREYGLILAYAIGTGVGTYLALCVQKRV